jgi:hypothetical protein
MQPAFTGRRLWGRSGEAWPDKADRSTALVEGCGKACVTLNKVEPDRGEIRASAPADSCSCSDRAGGRLSSSPTRPRRGSNITGQPSAAFPTSPRTKTARRASWGRTRGKDDLSLYSPPDAAFGMHYRLPCRSRGFCTTTIIRSGRMTSKC